MKCDPLCSHFLTCANTDQNARCKLVIVHVLKCVNFINKHGLSLIRRRTGSLYLLVLRLDHSNSQHALSPELSRTHVVQLTAYPVAQKKCPDFVNLQWGAKGCCFWQSMYRSCWQLVTFVSSATEVKEEKRRKKCSQIRRILIHFSRTDRQYTWRESAL